MRATWLLSGLVLASVASNPVLAADTPSASQLIDSLTPSAGPVVTRGIRLGGQAPAAPAAIRPMTPPHANNGAPPEARPVVARPAEANLSVPFATGSAEVSPSAARVLDRLGEALTSPKLADYRFRLEGHTDTVGQPESNKQLSEQRAAAVQAYLVTKYGIDRARLTPAGMGQDGLLVETGPGVPEPRNRRVLVVNLGR